MSPWVTRTGGAKKLENKSSSLLGNFFMAKYNVLHMCFQDPMTRSLYLSLVKPWSQPFSEQLCFKNGSQGPLERPQFQYPIKEEQGQ